MKNERVLHGMLLIALDMPMFDTEVNAWLLAHNLIAVNGVGGSVSLTVTGQNLLNTTLQQLSSDGLYALAVIGLMAPKVPPDGGSLSVEVGKLVQIFKTTLRNFHDAGQLRRPETNGTTKENNNTDQQTRAIGKGEARKGGKRRP
jgi:hypothetical protein